MRQCWHMRGSAPPLDRRLCAAVIEAAGRRPSVHPCVLGQSNLVGVWARGCVGAVWACGGCRLDGQRQGAGETHGGRVDVAGWQLCRAARRTDLGHREHGHRGEGKVHGAKRRPPERAGRHTTASSAPAARPSHGRAHRRSSRAFAPACARCQLLRCFFLTCAHAQAWPVGPVPPRRVPRIFCGARLLHCSSKVPHK